MGSLIRYEALLPLKHNSGREVEPEKIDRTFDELIQRFGAATLEPQHLLGRWRCEGMEYEDELLRLMVDVEDTPANREWFVKWKEVLKGRFEQIEIWLVWHPIHQV